MSHVDTSSEIKFGGRSDALAILTNAVSLGLVAISGIIINAVLAGYFGVDKVGQFNQLFALQLVISQISVFGIHLSCLHYLSNRSLDKNLWVAIAQSALLAVTITGLLVAIVLSASAELLERLLHSPELSNGIYWLAPAIAVFGINKTIISLHNSLDNLNTIAFLQAIRPVVCSLGMVTLVILDKANPEIFGQILFVAELIVLITSMIFMKELRFKSVSFQRYWFIRHLHFGFQAIPSHLAIELNSRIDMLILSHFANDLIVGIYSFVALLSEGVFQVGVVIRTIINRRLVVLLLNKSNSAALQKLKWQAGSWSVLITVAASVMLSAGFSPVITKFGLNQELLQGEHVLWILLCGVSVCAFYSPFWMSLVLAGKPVQHTMLMLTLCALNVTFCLILIPRIGMTGAAIASALMLISLPFLLPRLVMRALGKVL